jgi:hypothetical protein
VLGEKGEEKRTIRFAVRYEKNSIVYFIDDKTTPHSLHLNPKKLNDVVKTILDFHGANFAKDEFVRIYLCTEYSAFACQPDGNLVVAKLDMETVAQMFDAKNW